MAVSSVANAPSRHVAKQFQNHSGILDVGEFHMYALVRCLYTYRYKRPAERELKTNIRMAVWQRALAKLSTRRWWQWVAHVEAVTDLIVRVMTV